jgi:hypothetical protein
MQDHENSSLDRGHPPDAHVHIIRYVCSMHMHTAAYTFKHIISICTRALARIHADTHTHTHAGASASTCTYVLSSITHRALTQLLGGPMTHRQFER